jgi:hypothetical protein
MISAERRLTREADHSVRKRPGMRRETFDRISVAHETCARLSYRNMLPLPLQGQPLVLDECGER